MIVLTLTEEQYAKKSEYVKGIYSSDNLNGTNLNGRRTFLTRSEDGGTCLLIEGESLNIIK